MSRWRAFVVMLFAGVVFPGLALAQVDTYFERKEEGWWWYKDPPAPKKAEEPKKVEPPPPEAKKEPPEKPVEEKKEEPKPALFSVEWLRKNLEKLKVIAIDDPSPDNIAAYLYAQRIMLEKSDNFATVSARMAQTDPYLDENNRVPFSTAMRALTMRAEDQSKKEIMKQLAAKAGLFFFFDTRCKFCVIQQQMVDTFAKQYGFIVYNVSLDGKGLPGMTQWRRDNGKFKELGLTITPTVVLAVPPDQYLVLSQGTMSLDVFENRVLVAAEDRQLLPAEIMRTARSYDRGRITPEDLKKIGIEADPDDPKAWIAYIRKSLGTAY